MSIARRDDGSSSVLLLLAAVALVALVAGAGVITSAVHARWRVQAAADLAALALAMSGDCDDAVVTAERNGVVVHRCRPAGWQHPVAEVEVFVDLDLLPLPNGFPARVRIPAKARASL